LGELDDLISKDDEPDDSNELTIAAVLRHYGASRIPQGAGWKSMKCPFTQFHTDSRASASVNNGTNHFRCHACGTAGDPIDIIRKLEHMNYREACEQAARVFGTSHTSVSRGIPRHFKRPAASGDSWKEILG
jgi:DNA primase